jgi:hypothetical protein
MLAVVCGMCTASYNDGPIAQLTRYVKLVGPLEEKVVAPRPYRQLTANTVATFGSTVSSSRVTGFRDMSSETIRDTTSERVDRLERKIVMHCNLEGTPC